MGGCYRREKENSMTRKEAEAALAAHREEPWKFEDKPELCRTCMSR